MKFEEIKKQIEVRNNKNIDKQIITLEKQQEELRDRIELIQDKIDRLKERKSKNY